MFVDAVQGFGKVPFSVRRWGVVAVAVTTHTIHGPKGVGALWTSCGLRPILRGGGQEGGRRGGTASASMAWALTEAYHRQSTANAEVHRLRDRLWAAIQLALPEARLNGAPVGQWRVGNHLHLRTPGIPSEPLMR